MKKIEIKSVNISEKKGTIKVPVDSIELCETGVKGDAHAGAWHRMVSLLAVESVEKFEHKTHEISDNLSAQNIPKD